LEALTKQHALTDIEFDLIRQVLTNVGESIEEYSVEQKRAAIRTFIRKIIWDGEHAHIYLFHNDGDYDFPAPPATSGDSAADDQEFGDPLPNFGEPSGEDSE
ncbi:MAG: recombinase family protein, partial [Clostridiales bacterium]|nr:recombinase family protein [Clostridiales bacterium]